MNRVTRRASRRWHVAGVVIAAALVATLSGCSVEVAGVAGIGLDADGRLVGYIQMCDHHIDGATLYRSSDDELGKWRADGAITDFARWSLADPPTGWTADRPYRAPSDFLEYRLYGWTTDNSWSAQQVRFQLSDVNGLEPGEVLYSRGEPIVSTESEFRATACDDF